MSEKPKRLVYLNGEFVPETEANISVYDSALMFGDMVFEMTRSFSKKQFMLRQHLERLYRGIKQLRIPLKIPIDEMEQLVYKTMEVNEPAFEVQDEHRITELRHVKNPKGSVGGSDPDFPTARPDGRHGLPVVWFEAELHLFELKAGIVAGILRKVPKVVERRADPDDFLLVRHHASISVPI